ncbi:MAG TPA: ABC transporter permease, partial [Thermodesulfobacteriota bacterium]|nr:ABC transporter permease [Thermodesulfobacteriota bacterium]
MGFYIIKRLFLMVPLFIGITIISFAVIHLAPGSPVDMATDLNPKATAEVKERMRTLYGLDKPLHVQYWNWVRRLMVFDFGVSFSQDGRRVSDKILERMPITIFIDAVSMILIFLLAVPLGVLSATFQNSLFDKVTTVLVFIGFAVPHFWLALILMILFGVQLGWLPISGLKSLNYEYFPLTAQIWDRI